MNISALVDKLTKENIPKNLYSLDGKLKADAMILRNQKMYWEVFYFDEKGNEQNNKKIKTEEEACEYLYKILIENRNVQIKYRID